MYYNIVGKKMIKSRILGNFGGKNDLYLIW